MPRNLHRWFAVGLQFALSCAPASDPIANDGNLPGHGFSEQRIFTGLRSAILSISGKSATEIYAVGADLKAGDGPNFLAYDGRSWRRLKTGLSTGDLWWISVQTIDGSFYLAGAPGLILRFDPELASFERFETPGSQSMFGIWGTAVDNLWAVGGNLDNPNTGGVLWHFDGQSWRAYDISDLYPLGPPLLYKVWGRSQEEVYAVGTLGTILHFDGSSWLKLEADTQRSLFTVHGNADTVVASGGFAEAVLVELNGGAFVNQAPAEFPQMNGVFVPAIGRAVAVGNESSLATRTERGWMLLTSEPGSALDFHAVWVDPDGGAWAVGGNLISGLQDGMVTYFGSGQISTEVTRDGT